MSVHYYMTPCLKCKQTVFEYEKGVHHNCYKCVHCGLRKNDPSGTPYAKRCVKCTLMTNITHLDKDSGMCDGCYKVNEELKRVTDEIEIGQVNIVGPLVFVSSKWKTKHEKRRVVAELRKIIKEINNRADTSFVCSLCMNKKSRQLLNRNLMYVKGNAWEKPICTDCIS